MSHRPHGASDIIPGSRWPSARGPGCAIVLEAAAGWVTFAFTDGTMALPHERMHHFEFRRRFVAPYNSRAVRSWFQMALANLQQCHVFWHHGKPYARTTRRSVDEAFTPSRGRGGAVPQGAIHVGTYTTPFDPDLFFCDLHDALASSAATSHTAAAA